MPSCRSLRSVAVFSFGWEHALCPFLDLHYRCLADLRKSALQTDLELFTTTTLFTGIMTKRREAIWCSKLAYCCLKLKSSWSLDLWRLITHSCVSRYLLFEGGMEGWKHHYIFCSSCTSVYLMRDVELGAVCSWTVSYFPEALQHVIAGSRLRGNTLQCVPPRQHSLCAVHMMINAFTLAAMSGKKTFAVFSVFLLLYDENAVNKEPDPVWCRTPSA